MDITISWRYAAKALHFLLLIFQFYKSHIILVFPLWFVEEMLPIHSNEYPSRQQHTRIQ